MIYKYKSIFALFSIAALFSQASAQSVCGPENKCPQSSPCCSEFGFCGAGPEYCGGGCHVQGSFAQDSCYQLPGCLTKRFTFDNPSRVVSTAQYKGDPAQADWTYEGNPIIENNVLKMTLQKTNITVNGLVQGAGTRISSTHYVLYGKITAKLKSGRSPGVVTAFITMSNVRDEIDLEWVGKDLESVQTNYYYKGLTKYDNGNDYGNGEIHQSANTYDAYHEYTIDWTNSSIVWYMDGKVIRTLKKADTCDSAGSCKFPDSPSRVQLSLWDGGNGAEGTRNWAGGPIDWDGAPDMISPGYFFAEVEYIDVQCYGNENIGFTPPTLPPNITTNAPAPTNGPIPGNFNISIAPPGPTNVPQTTAIVNPSNLPKQSLGLAIQPALKSLFVATLMTASFITFA